MAIRISQVMALESPRKWLQLRCAFRKHSCVSVSARSTSLSDASRKRKICGRWLSTMDANSRAAISSASSAVMGLTAIPAAIGLVDATIRRKFTTPNSIFAPKRPVPQTRKGRERLASLLFSWMVSERRGRAVAIVGPLLFIDLSWAAMGIGDAHVRPNDIIRCGGIISSMGAVLDEAGY